LVSRKRNHYKSFESLKTALAHLKATDVILDGELVCLDGEGYSQFNQLLYRREEPVFYVFDLFWLNGHDLRQLPLIERKKQLHKLIANSECDRVVYAQHIVKRGIGCTTRFASAIWKAWFASGRTACTRLPDIG
jgi:ATP-dependent DNA ligase